MKFKRKYLINDTQIGLLYKDQQFQKVLNTGTHEYWDWKNRLTLQSVNIATTLSDGVSKDILYLAELHSAAFADHLQAWETGEHEIGLVYQQGILRDIKAPGQRGAYWKQKQAITIEKLDISENFSLSEKLLRVLSGAREPLLSRAAATAIALSNVAEGHIGFLIVDGNTISALQPGLHMWWKFNRVIEVKQFDLRLQNMEVNGQEILTKDRVSLRINLSAMWQITDAATVKRELADAKDYLYRELQLALRTIVSTQTLDELLADKNSLNQQVLAIVAEKAATYGIALKSVGARDIILPGEMKAILTQVVEAQKLAEANLIKRQEETQATRSLHNTAKVMEGNPVLLRLKELEVLEKITGKINTLNVYGGLDGVMNDLVRITDRKAAN
ncbi:MAG: slipin family protein [Cellvibrio sp.]|uniref:slipin family protein n=1 Tax=Cellvibrio sp. TaxID=1965322 RepID=UPI002727842F|nr:slipin family protein [Cellvibrio sp.]